MLRLGSKGKSKKKKKRLKRDKQSRLYKPLKCSDYSIIRYNRQQYTNRKFIYIIEYCSSRKAPTWGSVEFIELLGNSWLLDDCGCSVIDYVIILLKKLLNSNASSRIL